MKGVSNIWLYLVLNMWGDTYLPTNRDCFIVQRSFGSNKPVDFYSFGLICNFFKKYPKLLIKAIVSVFDKTY